MLRTHFATPRPAPLTFLGSTSSLTSQPPSAAKVTVVGADDSDEIHEPEQWLTAVQDEEITLYVHPIDRPCSPHPPPMSPCSSMSDSLLSATSSTMGLASPVTRTTLRQPRTHAFGVPLTGAMQRMYHSSDQWLPALQEDAQESQPLSASIDALERTVASQFRDVHATASNAAKAFEPILTLNHYLNAAQQAWVTRPAWAEKPVDRQFFSLLDAMVDATYHEYVVMARKLSIHRSTSRCAQTIVNALHFDRFVHEPPQSPNIPAMPTHLFTRQVKDPLHRAFATLRRSLQRAADQLTTDQCGIQAELSHIDRMRPRTIVPIVLPNPFFIGETLEPKSALDMQCTALMLEDYMHTLSLLHADSVDTQMNLRQAAKAITALYP